MTRRWKVAVWVGGAAVLAAGVAILGLAVLGGVFSDDTMCGNEVIREERSSDGVRKAVVFERNCGATTSYSTHVIILPAAAVPPNKNGNAFVAHVDPNLISLSWEGPKSLTISRPALPNESIFLAESHVEEVSVRHETRN